MWNNDLYNGRGQRHRLIDLVGGNIPGVLNAADYRWEAISWSAKEFADYGKARNVKQTIEVTGEPDTKREWNGKEPFGGQFGDRFRHVKEGLEFEDGTALVCASIKGGGDTFNSGELQTAFYLLTPKSSLPHEPEPEQPKGRAKRKR